MKNSERLSEKSVRKICSGKFSLDFVSENNKAKNIRRFCADVTATQAAILLSMNRKTINRYYPEFRQRIYAHQCAEKDQICGVVEVDESYFGATRPRGLAGAGKLKRERATLKQPVFGLFERDGRVYTEVVPDCSKPTLQRIIRGKVAFGSEIVSDGWRGYDGLVDVGFDQHLRINHREAFAQDGVHINGIESSWSFTKRRLAKFNGVTVNFDIHLTESEWRWGKDFDVMMAQMKQMIV